jgi:hypothetical protein
LKVDVHLQCFGHLARVLHIADESLLCLVPEPGHQMDCGTVFGEACLIRLNFFGNKLALDQYRYLLPLEHLCGHDFSSPAPIFSGL